MSNNGTTLNSDGMIGLKTVRDALGLSRKDLAGLTGLEKKPAASTIANFENGYRQGKFKTCRAIAAALCCEPADLLAIPTPERLAQIKADFDEARAAESRAAANGLKAVGQ